MPALSGVLITTGMGMLNPTEFKHCYAVQKSDAIPFAATIGGMVSMGLAEGIGIGCATAVGMNMYQTYKNNNAAAAASTSTAAQSDTKMKAFELVQSSSTSTSTSNTEAPDDGMIWQARCGTQLPMQLDARGMHTMVAPRLDTDIDTATEKTFTDNTTTSASILMDPSKNTVWQLNGPINFLSMFEIDNMMKKIVARSGSTDAIVLDMQGVTMVEFTGVEELVNRVIEASDDHGAVPIQMVNLTQDIEKALDQCDPTKRIERVAFHQ